MKRFYMCAILMLMFSLGERSASAASPIVNSEFIYESAPFRSVHASTIAQTSNGVVVSAFFGGTSEGKNDVGIWVSRHVNGQWGPLFEVATGIQPDGERFPCWNPVLFQPQSGELMLFYKVGPNPKSWWGMVCTSADDGATWSAPTRLPDGIVGPIKNKPVQLPNGDILSGCSTEDKGWRVHFERSADSGKTWERTAPVNSGSEFAAIQPSILLLGESRLLAIGRTRQGVLFQIASDDLGRTWNQMTSLQVHNPNSGTDAVTFADGRHLLVFNDTPKGRTPLNIAISSNGTDWKSVFTLEDQPGEYSYPAVIQTQDGLVHITYTWKRQKVKHIIVDPKTL